MVYGTYTCPTCTRGIGYLYLSHMYMWYKLLIFVPRVHVVYRLLIFVPRVHVVHLSSLSQIVICPEQLLVVPTESLTNREWLPGELLNGSEHRRPSWFLDMKYQTCFEQRRA